MVLEFGAGGGVGQAFVALLLDYFRVVAAGAVFWAGAVLFVYRLYQELNNMNPSLIIRDHLIHKGINGYIPLRGLLIIATLKT